MNTIIIFTLALLVYAALIYWLMKRFKFKQHWLGSCQGNKMGVISPLTHFVKRSLDVFLLFFLLIAVSIPVVVSIMAVSQIEVPTWGIDIGIFSGFKFDFSEIAGIEVFGVRKPEFSGQAIVSIDTSNLYAWYLYVVVSEISAMLAIYVTVQFRSMVSSLQSNEPFTHENSHRIKRVGIVIIAWNLLNPILQYFGWGAVVEAITFSNKGIQLYPAFEINLLALLIGLMVLLLSGMLQEATKIKQEQELTI
ncbi:MAG: DUF2975 domain-containing protein [Alcanivoracaceae bacterium]|nr:DUF2975 domain-containing protein [Alcanivoracaceae bacterium]